MFFDDSARQLAGVVGLYGSSCEEYDRIVGALARLVDGPLHAAAPEAFPKESDIVEVEIRIRWVLGISQSRAHSGRYKKGNTIVVVDREKNVTRRDTMQRDDPPAIVPFSLPNHGIAGVMPTGHIQTMQPGEGTTYVWSAGPAGLREGEEVRYCCSTLALRAPSYQLARVCFHMFAWCVPACP